MLPEDLLKLLQNKIAEWIIKQIKPKIEKEEELSTEDFNFLTLGVTQTYLEMMNERLGDIGKRLESIEGVLNALLKKEKKKTYRKLQ